MYKSCVAFGLILISFNNCKLPNTNANVKQNPEIIYDVTQFPISLCGLEGFYESPLEHIIVEIKQPFIVRKVKGKIGIVDNHPWPKDIRVLFEIRGLPRDGRIKKAYADGNGKFVIKNIPEGQYCFKATAEGWQTVMGTIIVNKKASRKSKIVFDMEFGV